MKYKISGKQPNSKLCFVCGLKNPFGLKASFYETSTKELIAIFKPSEMHQSYPGRLHGGIASTILDETIGRAIMMNHEDEVWGVTLEFNAKYRKQIPLDCELKVIGRLTKETGRSFEGKGEIVLPDGEVAVTGEGKYLRMPIEKIANFDREENDWRVVRNENEPEEIEI
ncbi:MAG: PaaI family thioesterase [Ignavibacteriae bacterium]|nr:PaaI family thioesterase [Ignavibacteriota bacterium]